MLNVGCACRFPSAAAQPINLRHVTPGGGGVGIDKSFGAGLGSEQAACKFYEGLTEKAVNNCHVIDIFACSLDQIGLLEMKVTFPVVSRRVANDEKSICCLRTEGRDEIFSGGFRNCKRGGGYCRGRVCVKTGTLLSARLLNGCTAKMNLITFPRL